MTDRDRKSPPAANAVTVSGGTFTGVNVVGQHNRVRVDSVAATTDLADLRSLVESLTTELAADPAHGVAHEQAGQLAEELAEPQPRPGRINRIWQRLRGSLDALTTIGTDVGRIAELVPRLFGGG